MLDKAFWSGKRVLITGHTGFKGSWLSLWLIEMQAKVFGLSLAPKSPRALFHELELGQYIDDGRGDIRELDVVRNRFKEVRPDIVFHLAAQPLVRESYINPLETWQTNVMGTANILAALREIDKPKCAAVIVTTDKVYENKEWEFPYQETDRLGGHDPYSASKAASELLVRSWMLSFTDDSTSVQFATARAGNVIGGGDWATDRIVPDVVRAATKGCALVLRNPHSTRPWQHVLDPLRGYMMLAQQLYEGPFSATALNFGPHCNSVRSVSDLVGHALLHFPELKIGESEKQGPYEARSLSLSIDLAQSKLGWSPVWDFQAAVERTFEWYARFEEGTDARGLCVANISEYMSDAA